MSNQDACVCDHVRYIHNPTCRGRYPVEEWSDENRDCICKEFVLGKKYVEPKQCPTCGNVTEESHYE